MLYLDLFLLLMISTKNIKSIYLTMLSNAYCRTRKWALHLVVAVDDFANARNFLDPPLGTRNINSTTFRILDNQRQTVCEITLVEVLHL